MKGKRKNNIFVYITAALVAFLALITAIFGGWGNLPAFADNTAESAQAVYEKSNVLDDLQGSTIGGEKFDIKDYPYNAAGEPQVLSFVEFCYSADEARQGDFGLYVYVYNPREKEIAVDGDNAIQFVSGGIGSVKRGLTYLNYSVATGSEGRFYKFKINLSSADKSGILRGQSQNERVYEVVEIELSVGGEVKNYPCNQTYKFAGFAKGYGSELAAEDTLSCTVDGLETVLSLDVHPTYYRPKGTHADGVTRDTLHSVYFSVPNEIIEAYGEMTAVHATWLNALTAPIFVTGNKDVYNAMFRYVGQYVDGGSDKNYDLSGLKYGFSDALGSTVIVPDGWENPLPQFYNYIRTDRNNESEISKSLFYLNYLFYADNGDADNYTVTGDALLKYMKNFTDKFYDIEQNQSPSGSTKPDFGDTQDPGISVCSDVRTTSIPPIYHGYSGVLFEQADTAYTNINIRATDEFDLYSCTVNTDWWSQLFGKPISDENVFKAKAIQKVTTKDLNFYQSAEIFCDNFYVAYGDYTAFSDYVRAAEDKNETVYLFRYYQSEYYCCEKSNTERVESWALLSGYTGGNSYLDTNAYLAKMWVQLDFDIIDVTYTKDGVSTVIPVAMSPMDIAADVQPPSNTTDDTEKKDDINFGNWWAQLMAKIKEFFSAMPWWGWLIIGLVALSLLMPLLSLVFPAVGTVLAAVVKGLVQIFKYLFIGLWYVVKYLFIGLWYIISAPVRFIVWIVRKVRGG